MARLDEDRAAMILAECVGNKPSVVAARYGVSTETIRNYRKRAEADVGFAELVAKKRALIETQWAAEAISFLRAGLQKLEELVGKATPSPGVIREVAGAIKVVGELQIVRSALGQQPGGNREAPAPAADDRDGAGDEPSGVH